MRNERLTDRLGDGMHAEDRRRAAKPTLRSKVLNRRINAEI